MEPTQTGLAVITRSDEYRHEYVEGHDQDGAWGWVGRKNCFRARLAP